MESALTTAPPSHRRACVPVTVSPRTAASRPRAASSSMRLAEVRWSTQSWRFSQCCRRLVGGRERGARASVRGARRGAPDAHRSAGRFPQSRSRRRGDDLDPRGTRHRDFVRKRSFVVIPRIPMALYDALFTLRSSRGSRILAPFGLRESVRVEPEKDKRNHGTSSTPGDGSTAVLC